ncbi:MAG TPA: Cof-type HAD-IIB family hydrolase [Ktedonobacterales bacterium]
MRLIATDLDGTLLRSDGSISRRTRTLLVSLRERDIPLVMVSARPPRDLRQIGERIGAEGIAVGCNGALIYDLTSDTILDHWLLSPRVAMRLVTDLRQMLPDAYFAIECGLRYGWERGYLAIRGRQPEDESLIADALELCSVPVSKLLMRHPTLSADEMLALGRKVAGNEAVATHSGARLLEISAVGVDKASALAALCGRMGIASSNVVAFGDQPNDISMLRWAGHGVAVANAHAEVFAMADAVTASNDEDGVARALESLLG